MSDTAINGRINAALARALADSPRAGALAAALRGRSLAVRVAATRWSVMLRSHGEQLELVHATAEAAGAAAVPDATMSGSVLSLLALAGADPEAVIRRGDVRIEGDAEVAGRFRELVRLLRPDFEHELSRLVGAVPAHLASGALRGALGWARRAASTTLRNTADYLAHERRDLVPHAEAERLLRDGERLRDDGERLEARLAELERRVRALRGAG